MAHLLVGLGNPGEKYKATRHNIGFRILDHIALHLGLTFSHQQRSQHASFRSTYHSIDLLKPMTYMNESGRAVAQWMRQKGIMPAHILVIYDDLYLPLGKLRLRPSGSAGGHNGIKSITEKLGTPNYPRLRFGIGSNFAKGQQANYVLSRFTPAEENTLSDAIEQAHNAAISYIEHGLEATMQTYNASQ